MSWVVVYSSRVGIRRVFFCSVVCGVGLFAGFFCGGDREVLC